MKGRNKDCTERNITIGHGSFTAPCIHRFLWDRIFEKLSIGFENERTEPLARFLYFHPLLRVWRKSSKSSVTEKGIFS
jgi:hypothetical protein